MEVENLNKRDKVPTRQFCWLKKDVDGWIKLIRKTQNCPEIQMCSLIYWRKTLFGLYLKMNSPWVAVLLRELALWSLQWCQKHDCYLTHMFMLSPYLERKREYNDMTFIQNSQAFKTKLFRTFCRRNAQQCT